MLSFFRRFLGSRFGAYIALGFLALVAFAFAAGDISNHGGLGVLTGGGGDNAAKVDGRKLSTTEVQARAQRIFEQQRRASPGFQIGTFLSEGGVEQVFDQMVAGLTISAFAEKQGMSVSKRMVDGQIAGIQAFQDASGTFSPDLFRQILGREGISEPALRDDISRELLGKQLIGPAGLGVKLTDSLVLPYASLLLEARAGRIAAIPSVAFLPKTDPTDAQLATFYAANADRFTVPEQRRLRYATVDAARFDGAATPTDAEIATAFAQNKAAYAPKETRSFERLVLPTEAVAKGIAADVKSGKSMAEAAKSAGLAVATLSAQTRDMLAREGSDAIAQAGFTAAKDALIGPIRSPLGWQLLRVTAIDRTPGQTLEQVKPKIIETLRTQKAQQLLSDFTGKIEDQVSNGATFDEVAKDNALTIETTPLILSSGQSVPEPSYKASPDVAALLKPGFDMSADDDAQLVPVTPDKRYALLDVENVVAAAPPPLAKVRAAIVQQYQRNQGYLKAKAIAEQLRVKIAKGMKLEDAIKSAGVPLPAVQRVGGRRADLMRGEQRPPAEIALLFAMAPGSVKTLAIPGDQGYFLVQLDGIKRGDAATQPGLVDTVRGQLAQAVSAEYVDQFEHAIERQLGVTRDAGALAKVKQELRRANGVTP